MIPNWNVFGSYNYFRAFCDFCVTLPTRRMVVLFHTDSTETLRTANFRDFCDFRVTLTHTPDGFIISHRKH